MFGFRKHVIFPEGIMVSFFLMKKNKGIMKSWTWLRNMFLQFQARQILVDGSDGTCDRQIERK